MLKAVKEQTLRGTWWIPGSKQRVGGRLTLSREERPALDLEGDLRDFFDKTSTPLIHGIDHSGKRLTLFRCQRAAASINIGGQGPSTATYVAALVLLGYHFKTEERIRFKKVGALFDHIAEWTRRSGFNYEYRSAADTEDNAPVFTLSYRYPQFEPITIPGATIRLEAEVLSEKLMSVNEHSFYEKTFIAVTPASPLPIEDLLSDYVGPVQHFLSFGIGQPVYVDELYGILDESDVAADGERDPGRVEMYYPARRKLRNERHLLEPYMLFSLADLGDTFPACLTRWFENRELLSPAYNLYFSVLFASELYSETRFLNLVQAVEVLHRKRWSGQYLDEAEYEPLRERMKQLVRDAVGRVRGEPLIGRLVYWNEWSLRQRIKDSVDRCGSWVATLIPDRDAFAGTVVDTRNFLTHYDRRLEDAAAKGPELYVLAERVRFLLEGLLLLSLGIEQERAGEIITDTQHYLWLRDSMGLIRVSNAGI